VAGWQHSHATEQQDLADPASAQAEIILFPHPRVNGVTSPVPAIVSIPEDRQMQAVRGRALYGGLLVGSLAAHAAFLIFLNREPTPAPSLGEEVISVEIVVGANTQAGNAERPSDADTDNPATEPDTEERPIETAQDPQPEEKPAEPETARATEEPKAVEEALPSTIAAPPKPKTPASPSVASRGVGRGSSASDANYSARVAAHLARFKRFPAEARARSQRGSTMVSFALDGDGRVTSARLVRGSGVTLLDNEVVAMVHRASPFPRPPDGRPKNFTAPVSFQLN